MAASRPAQGRNSNPIKPPRPAYKSDAGPVIKSRGTVSNPKDTGAWRLKRLVTDETPKVTKR